jgi:hypothetical protein
MGKLWNARECNLESVQRALLSPWGQEQTSHNWAMRDHLQSDREWAEGDSKRHDSAVVIDGKKIKKIPARPSVARVAQIPACPGPPGQGGQGLQELFVRSLPRSLVCWSICLCPQPLSTRASRVHSRASHVLSRASRVRCARARVRAPSVHLPTKRRACLQHRAATRVRPCARASSVCARARACDLPVIPWSCHESE